MTQDTVMQLATQTLWMTILIAGPLLLSALAIGLLVGMFQAATQINEMTLSFIPKLGVLVAALFIFGPWMLSNIVDFTQRLIPDLPGLQLQFRYRFPGHFPFHVLPGLLCIDKGYSIMNPQLLGSIPEIQHKAGIPAFCFVPFM